MIAIAARRGVKIKVTGGQPRGFLSAGGMAGKGVENGPAGWPPDRLGRPLEAFDAVLHPWVAKPMINA